MSAANSPIAAAAAPTARPPSPPPAPSQRAVEAALRHVDRTREFSSRGERYEFAAWHLTGRADEGDARAADSIFDMPSFDTLRRIQEEDIRRRLVGPELQNGIVKCKKCKSMKTESVGVQTRSADEPMTFINSCYQCNYEWRSNG